MRRRVAILCGLLPAMLVLPATASGQVKPSRTFLICQTGSVASAEEAQPYIDGFGGYLAGKLGWAAGSFEVRFENRRSQGLKALTDWQPAFATISLGLFLEQEEKQGLKPLVLARVNGKATNRYRVLVKKGTFSNLDELKGKTLEGNLLDEPAFLSRVIFGRKLEAASHFVLKPTPRPLKAIKNVSQGKADAALVDDLQYEALKGLPFFAELQVIHESPDFPNLGMVYLKNRADDGDIRSFSAALVGMCRDPEGKKMCETFAVEGFEAVTDETLETVRKLYR